MLLSIIIPVYNGEKTLSCLLDPILGIKRDDIELILVDDGSKDESYSICKKYAKNDSRVKTIHIENSGVSTARNIGLHAASGKYIYFCDCDDRVFTEALIKIFPLLERNNYDLIMANYVYIYLDLQYSRSAGINLTANRPLTKSEIIEQMISPLILKTGTGLASLWNKFFLSDIIKKNGLQFNSKIHKGEDWQFILNYLRFADSMYFSPENIYEYRLDGSQSESKYKKTAGIHRLSSVKLKMSLADEFGIDVPKDVLLGWCTTQMDELVFSARSPISKKEWNHMVNDDSVRFSAKQLLLLNLNDYLYFEISRKYKVFSFFIILGAKRILRTLIKRI